MIRKLLLSPNAPLWQLSFRPFFLFGSFFGVLTLIIWIFFQAGSFEWSHWLSPVYWHVHEMVFGFTLAIIIGFLFTASQNWTGIRGVHGRQLQFLFIFWLLARLGMLIPAVPASVTISIEMLFFVFSIIWLYPYLKSKQQNRNKIFIVFLLFLFVMDWLLLFGDKLNTVLMSRQSYLLAIGLVILIISLIAGRVIPFFTQKAVVGARIQKFIGLEILTIVMTILSIVLYIFDPSAFATSIIVFSAAVVHGLRWLFWRPWQSRKIPILWILHVGYFWIILSFILMGLSLKNSVPVSSVIHALTIGVISIMILGMISRVCLGHTGRRIWASSWMVLAYWLIIFATFVRVFSSLFWPEFYIQSIQLSGILWILSFVIFIVEYTPILLRPRADA